FLLSGPDDPAELVRQTKRGVYVVDLSGGEVNPATGEFLFGMTEGYLIEDGEVGQPLQDANLIGSCRDVLANIDGVGWDGAMAPGGGMCGKQGQVVPVGMGQPTVRLRGITIGGTRVG
ncbi:MAG: metallopeptidase TldD-related protein, partial [Actinomycetota bacterium]|nr:metallopeptidase TldD-related protein [Actinomycetota bacterium]